MVKDSFYWVCPYCHRETTIVPSTNCSTSIHYYESRSKVGYFGLLTKIIVCPNKTCAEYSIIAELYSARINIAGHQEIIPDKGPFLEWILRPASSAIPQPEYIPSVIRNDYEEACAILHLSPKASATLSRRCLQGMIRDFWGIRKPRLIDEIEALQPIIEPLTWEAIDAIREIGNIGAHMEKDVNTIIEIEPSEANLLINLIEDLFQTWYVQKHDREERFKKIQAIVKEKKEIKL